MLNPGQCNKLLQAGGERENNPLFRLIQRESSSRSPLCNKILHVRSKINTPPGKTIFYSFIPGVYRGAIFCYKRPIKYSEIYGVLGRMILHGCMESISHAINRVILSRNHAIMQLCNYLSILRSPISPSPHLPINCERSEPGTYVWNMWFLPV